MMFTTGRRQLSRGQRWIDTVQAAGLRIDHHSRNSSSSKSNHGSHRSI